MRIILTIFFGFYLLSCTSGDGDGAVGFAVSCNLPSSGACNLAVYRDEQTAEASKAACSEDADGEGLVLVDTCPTESCVSRCVIDRVQDGISFTQTIFAYENYDGDDEANCPAETGAVFTNSCNF